MESIEDIILRHSRRGMDCLRPLLPSDFCHAAARAALSCPRGNVLLATGFYVKGFAETDGPAGIWVIARALRALGYNPIVVTDTFCQGYFEPEGLSVIYLPFDADESLCAALLEQYRPVLLFSLERCGINAVNDYMNMAGDSIRSHTAPVDKLFSRALGIIPTIGVGDGGNEIGMGKLSAAISARLDLIPCRVETDQLIIATVSNWGGYGFVSCLAQMTGMDLLPTFDEICAFIQRTVDLGCVDGVMGKCQVSEDGYDISVTHEIVDALCAAQHDR